MGYIKMIKPTFAPVKYFLNNFTSEEENFPGGFTLIEIMVVLLIIAVLAGIVTVRYDLFPTTETLRKDSASLKTTLLAAQMKAINESAEYGVKIDILNGQYYMVSDSLVGGSPISEGPIYTLEPTNFFVSTDFEDDIIMFNSFGELTEECLPEDITEGEIIMTNDSGFNTRINILLTTGRIKEYLR